VAAEYDFIITPPPPGKYEIVLTSRYLMDPTTYVNTINLIVEAPEVLEHPTT
jgi:hypothetical protein